MTIRASACKSLGLNQIFLINYSSTLKEYTMMLILKKAHIEKKIITYRFFWFFDQAFVFKTYTTYKHDKTKNESVFLGWWSWNIFLYEMDVRGIDNGCTGIPFTVFKVESCYLKDIFSKPLNIRSKYIMILSVHNVYTEKYCAYIMIFFFFF